MKVYIYNVWWHEFYLKNMFASDSSSFTWTSNSLEGNTTNSPSCPFNEPVLCSCAFKECSCNCRRPGWHKKLSLNEFSSNVDPRWRHIQMKGGQWRQVRRLHLKKHCHPFNKSAGLTFQSHPRCWGLRLGYPVSSPALPPEALGWKVLSHAMTQDRWPAKQNGSKWWSFLVEMLMESSMVHRSNSSEWNVYTVFTADPPSLSLPVTACRAAVV